METGMTIDPAELRRCLGSFVTGVTVITAVDEEGALHGMTANSFSSVSLDPPLIVWSLRTSSASFDAYRKAPRFVVNILAEEQIHVSALFAKPGLDRFAAIPWSAGLGGVPLIDGCAAHIECRLEEAYPGGDHVLFLGRVERIVTRVKKPLAFGLGKYMVVQPHDQNTDFSGNVASLGAVHAARSALDEISRQTDMTVGLGVWGNVGPTMIWFNESSRPLHLRLRCGMVMPLLTSATGRVFAAYAPGTLVEPYIVSELSIANGAAGEFATREEVDIALQEVRQRQLGSVRGSFLENVFERCVNAVSAPVFDGSGEIVLALTMMSHDEGFDEDHPAVQLMQAAARNLSSQIGMALEPSKL